MSVSINLDEIFNTIALQMRTVFDSLGITGKIFIEQEQMFLKRKDLSVDNIYISVKFGNASIDIGQAILPITINAITKGNRQNDTRSLFLSYALTYTLTRENGITQVYQTASNTENFQDVDATYRSTYSMDGDFIIGVNCNYIESITYGSESLKYLKATWGYSNSLKPQARYNDAITHSENQFTTHTLTIETYPLLNSSFLSAVSTQMCSKSPSVNNSSYTLTITFTDGNTYTSSFKVASSTPSQELGKTPYTSIVLTE